jgi:hypothetical protein
MDVMENMVRVMESMDVAGKQDVTDLQIHDQQAENAKHRGGQMARPGQDAFL